MTDEHWVPEGIGMHAPDLRKFYRRVSKVLSIALVLVLFVLFPGQAVIGTVFLAFIAMGLGGVLAYWATAYGRVV